MSLRPAVFAILLLAGGACAEPAVVASGSYPEGLLWQGGRMYFTELGADRVDVIEDGKLREFWRDPHCGPTSVAAFGSSGLLVTCHLGRHVVELSPKASPAAGSAPPPTATRCRTPMPR
jgi:hypothetical protein